MIKIKNNSNNSLYNYPVNTDYTIKLDKLSVGEKISIFSNAMFMTMFENEARIAYSALLASYFIEDITFEELLKNIVLVKNELDKTHEKKKGLRSDYIAQIGNSKLNIEINNNYTLEVMERNIEYAFRLYANKANRGSKSEYTQVVQLNLNNFAFEGNDKIIDIYTLRNDEGLNLTNKIIIVQIYVPNLRKKWYTSGIESLNELERYILTLTEQNIEDSLKLGKGHRIMEDYIKDAINASGDEILLEAYDKEWALTDLGKHEGFKAGYSEGMSEGIQQGIQEGIKQGIYQNKLEIVLTMLSKNMKINLISEITGLSIDEINKIKSNK